MSNDDAEVALFVENLFMQPEATEMEHLALQQVPGIPDPAAESRLAPARPAATLAEGRIHPGVTPLQGLHSLCSGLCLRHPVP